jgi:hypothetical protein
LLPIFELAGECHRVYEIIGEAQQKARQRV